MGLEQLQKSASKNFNLEILSNVWKPAHLWLAPCWNGQALPLMNQRYSHQANIKNQMTQQYKTNQHQKHSKMALCATNSFMLREVTAPKCYHQAKVFHELNPPKIELLQDVLGLLLHLHLCRPHQRLLSECLVPAAVNLRVNSKNLRSVRRLKNAALQRYF